MNRRQFLRNLALGFGALYTASATGLARVAQTVGLNPRNKTPFPVWDAKWKLAGKRGWSEQTRMNLPEGVMPPRYASRAGVEYELFRFNEISRKVWYFRKLSPDAKPVTEAYWVKPESLAPQRPLASDKRAIGFVDDASMMVSFDVEDQSLRDFYQKRVA